MEFTRNERRNVHIGAGVACVILIVLAVFFNDASKGVQGAIAMFAVFSAFVVFHALDEREWRREQDD